MEITDVRTLELALSAHADMAKSMEAWFSKLAKNTGKLGKEVETARTSIKKAVAAPPTGRIQHIQNAERAKAQIAQLMPEISSDFKAAIEEWTAHVKKLKSFQPGRR
ncbi:MAG: hypothetical protein PHX77_06210 [Candidatus Bipolaricaulis sp.]|nr:hypothetical protein [Candidatus Bipolaricaulis sp.]MDD5646481.1 hypothetical protein [Candidatus Bipolaricaulis sp.]